MRLINWRECSWLQLLSAACLIVAITGSATAAEIYKWVDENGTTHYSNVRPKGMKWTLLSEDKVSIISADRIGAEAAKAAQREAARTAGRVPSSNQSSVAGTPPVAPTSNLVWQRREVLMRECLRNRGVDCDREVDTELRAGGNVVRTVPPPVSTVSPPVAANLPATPTPPADGTGSAIGQSAPGLGAPGTGGSIGAPSTGAGIGAPSTGGGIESSGTAGIGGARAGPAGTSGSNVR